ncbi:MAG: hypothetical protein ACR652_17910 [Methylocystis sp.]
MAVAAVSIALAGGAPTLAKATETATAQGWLYIQTETACQDAGGKVLD